MENRVLMHQAEAGNLSSGSPILQAVDGEYFIRGVYINRDRYVLINKNILETIQKWFTTTKISIS